MKIENYIAINELCNHYEIDISFFTNLNEIGLIEITTIESSFWIDREKIHTVEKMIRLHKDLDINIEGIDTIFNLLDKIEELQRDLNEAKNRLRFYE